MKLLIGSLGKLLALLITLLPSRARMALGTAIGILWFDILRVRRGVAVGNVRLAYPEKSEKEVVSIARSSLRSMGKTIVEYGLISFFQSKIAPRNFTFENEENLKEAMAQGKGVIMLTLHLGNGDLATAELSRRGYPMNLISKEFTTKWLNDLWFGMRERVGTKFISARRSSFDILRALKKNEIVIFVLDQFMGPPLGVRTQFFGKETGTAMGCALMAERTGAPVIPTYTYRRDDGSHVIVFEKAIPYLDDGPREQNIATMTQKYTDKIESIVRLHPGQWMWIHRRWKEFRE
jgi:Kdo2-lipid IVA lauroyltransferase/acyltransferase